MIDRVVVTPRTVLRCFRVADAPLLKQAIDSSLPDLQAWMPWALEEPSPVEAIERRIAGMRTRFAAGADFPYGVFDRAEARVLGGAGLHPRRGPGVLEIGYWIRSDSTGRGLATEVARALTELAFAAHRIPRVEIRCDPNNARSAGVPRRLGYRLEATLVGDTQTPRGEPRDTMVWVMERAAPAP